MADQTLGFKPGETKLDKEKLLLIISRMRNQSKSHQEAFRDEGKKSEFDRGAFEGYKDGLDELEEIIKGENRITNTDEISYAREKSL